MIDRMNSIEELQWKQKVGKTGFCKGVQIPTFSINLSMVEGGRTLAFLDSGDREIRRQSAISSHIVDFYKGLFGHNEPYNLSLSLDL